MYRQDLPSQIRSSRQDSPSQIRRSRQDSPSQIRRSRQDSLSRVRRSRHTKRKQILSNTPCQKRTRKADPSWISKTWVPHSFCFKRKVGTLPESGTQFLGPGAVLMCTLTFFFLVLTVINSPPFNNEGSISNTRQNQGPSHIEHSPIASSQDVVVHFTLQLIRCVCLYFG